jgi:hypothetical protein
MIAYYNKYFDTICVIDNQDIFLWKSTTGKAAAIHENIFSDLRQHVICSGLDSPARKVYVTSESGKFKILNIKNGVDLADVNIAQQDRLLDF